MNLKEFLKPDWKKILIFFSIVVLAYVINNYVMYEIKMCAPEMCPEYSLIEISVMKIVVTLHNILFFASPLLMVSTFTTIFNWILSLVFWYLLSCIIISIYDKFRGRKI